MTDGSSVHLPRTDALLISHPKSGRTWLRFMLATYLYQSHRGPELPSPDLQSMFGFIPNLGSHPQKGLESLWRPGHEPTVAIAASHNGADIHHAARAIVLLRDPAETLTSHYFHETRHLKGARFDGSFEEFLASPHGIPRLCTFLSAVAPHLEEPTVMMLTYDDLHRDALGCLRRVLTWAGDLEPDADALDAAVAMGSFEAMKRIEADSGMLGKSRRIADPEARRIRRGERDRGSSMIDEVLRQSIRVQIAHELGDDVVTIRRFGAADRTL